MCVKVVCMVFSEGVSLVTQIGGKVQISSLKSNRKDYEWRRMLRKIEESGEERRKKIKKEKEKKRKKRKGEKNETQEVENRK